MKKKKSKKYDLEERTAKFSEDIIKFAKKIPINSVTTRIIPQLVAAGTSMGANYCEADGAASKADFRNKIALCRKEAKETRYWLRLVCFTLPNYKNDAVSLTQEVHELTLIFSAILKR